MLLLSLPTEKTVSLPDTYTVKEGVYQETLWGDAVLCYTSIAFENGEVVDYPLSSGEKVSRGQVVALQYPKEAAKQVQELAQLREQQTKQNYGDLEEAYLRAEIVAWQKTCATGNQAAAREKLLGLLAAYQGKPDQEETARKEKIEELQNRLPPPKAEITSPKDGYFYPLGDGYEEIWDNLSLPISPEAARAGLSATPKQETTPKLVCGFEIQVIFTLSPEAVGKLRLEETYALTLADETSLSVTLTYKAVGETGEQAVAVFSAPMPPTAHLPKRIQRGELVIKEESLLRVPKNGVLREGERDYVLVSHGGRALARGVKVTYQTDIYCYLSPTSGKVELFGEKCPYLKKNETVLLETEKYKHRDILD